MTDKPKPTAGDRERARRIIDKWIRENKFGVLLSSEYSELRKDFAQALASERERCARVAEK